MILIALYHCLFCKNFMPLYPALEKSGFTGKWIKMIAIAAQTGMSPVLALHKAGA
jgi:hypothetical protein